MTGRTADVLKASSPCDCVTFSEDSSRRLARAQRGQADIRAQRGEANTAASEAKPAGSTCSPVRGGASLALAVALTAGGLAAPLHGQQQFVIFLSLLDQSGNAPGSLSADQILITENGTSTDVIKIERIDWPVKVQVLVDNGVGMGSENLIHLRNGLRELMKVLPAGVEVALYTTAPQPRPVVRGTSDRLALLQGVDRISPDGGAGRYVESLNEAAQRIERDKTNYFPVIISVATAAGDTNVMERDVEALWRRLHQRPTTVHTVMLSGARSPNSFAGANQTQVGLAVKDLTRGRYDNIAAASRLATLLPEIGAQVAESHQRQSRQFRLTVERPSGSKGPIGTIGGNVPAGYTARITGDGAMP
jgi:hypothetical protein